MFLIAADSVEDLSVGQTAFVLGSHILEVSENIMVREDLSDLCKRLIRPHLSPGDALFFDCRILHFGLANQSNTARFPSSLSPRNLYTRARRVGELRMSERAPIASGILIIRRLIRHIEVYF